MNTDKYFLKYAFDISQQSSCYSTPKGAVIVKDDTILSTGFNNVPNGSLSCKSKYGYCYRRKLGYLTGEGLQYCQGIHAEAFAISNAAKNGISINHSILYSTHLPCNECAKLIIVSGIEKILYSNEYNSLDSIDTFYNANIILKQISDHHESSVRLSPTIIKQPIKDQ